MRSSIALLLSSIAAASVLLPPGEARANGRFPESNAYFFAPNDPNLVILRVTFGLLISKDRGATWDHVCEPAMGLTGSEDPMIAITPKGSFIGSTFSGVALSPDKGCSWSFAKGPIADLVFVDLSSRPATPEKIIAFASSYAGQDSNLNPLYESNLWETSDEGQTWARLTPVTIDKGLLGETVDVAPSDDQRIYVTMVKNAGAETREGVLLVSSDHGKTFDTRTVPLEGSEKAPFIAAVHPTNPDRLYIRTSNATDRPSRLLVSDDAGKTYRTIFTGAGPLMGIAFTPDHSKVWVGGPADGLHVASTTDFVFTKKAGISIQCLSHQSDGLWACSNEAGGFVAGVSKDEGATFQAKLNLCGIRGTLECPAGTLTNFECVQGGKTGQRAQTWPAQNARLGCVVDPLDGGVAGGADASPASAAPEGDGGGCAMTAATPRRYAPVAAGLAAILAGAAFARRRRRRR